MPNQNRGFQAFWWGQNSNSPYYFQVEETRLCIKIVEEQKEKQRKARKNGAAYLLSLPQLQDLSFRKPDKPRMGKTMTVLVKDNYIQTDDNGIVDMSKTIKLLKRLDV
ncbi:hypothetical protein [Domibacillus aminovorans]|uniref:Uncharacterized protein n=1 Tax=Domibacillus aminovorans TaxID=29332 RepID=A0A177L5W6_9BACI|nr:hypothetical protein [Domibacillus aminovorans]OAH60692.1 hypothetical protein AWH49_02780 [Domibacillus aminovorans]